MMSSDVPHSGWLYKLSWINVRRSWRKRFFVLHEKELRYYRQPDDRPAGVIDLKHYVGVVSHSTKQSTCAFRIESGCRYHRSQVLYADSPAEAQQWIRLIDSHIRKTNEHDSCCPSGSGSEITYDSSSVLDKWLERLDLQDNNKPTTTRSSSSYPVVSVQEEKERPLHRPTTSSVREERPPSLSIRHHYAASQSTESLESYSETLSSPSVGSPASISDYRASAVLASALALRRSASRGGSSTLTSPQEVVLDTTTEWDLFHFEQDEDKHHHRSIPPPSGPPPTAPLPPLPHSRR